MNNLRLALAVALLLFAISMPVKAGDVPKAESTTASSLNTSWVSEPWTADDKPFQFARLQIEKLIKKRYSPEALATKYAKLQQKQTTNPILVFRWGMAVFYASQSKNDVWEPPNLRQLLTAIATTPSPQSREYARMRFLIEARFAGENNLKRVGQRLLLHNPNDVAVKLAMFSVLNVLSSSEDGAIAIKYARQIIAASPTKPLGYRKLGGVYYLISIRSNTNENVQNALHAYETYLKYAKPNDPFSPRAKYLINILQKTAPG